MQLRRIQMVGLLGMFLGGCATTSGSGLTGAAPPMDYVPLDQMQIAYRFQTVEVNAANLGIAAARCIPQLSADTPDVGDTALKLPLPPGRVTALSHQSSANSFVISGSKAICLHQSSAHRPIFAGEAFTDTVNPTGVPPTVTNGWYVQIARRMAEAGRVTVAYTFRNGNAVVASYWVEPPNKNVIHYANEFRNAGNWETGTYDFRFTHASLTGATATARGTQTTKADLIGTP